MKFETKVKKQVMSLLQTARQINSMPVCSVLPHVFKNKSHAVIERIQSLGYTDVYFTNNLYVYNFLSTADCTFKEQRNLTEVD